MKRASSPGAGRAVHPAHPEYTWSQESLFNRLSRQAMFRPASAATTEAVLRDACGVRNPLLSYVGAGPERQLEALEELMQQIECPEVADLPCLTGSDLLPKEDRNAPRGTLPHPAFSTSLRYCRACIALGFHCMLFQHWAMTHCPLHGAKLIDKCCGCGLPIVPTTASVVANPYCCMRCQQLLLKMVPPSNAHAQLELVNGLVADWRRDVVVPKEGAQMRVSVVRLDAPLPTLPELQALRTRLLRRATVWPAMSTSRWPRFLELTGRLPEDFTPPRWRPANSEYQGVEDAPNKCLTWLIETCAVPTAESFSLVSGSWLRIQYITPQYDGQRLSALAGALHLTMAKYGRQRINFLRAKYDPASVYPYLGVSWNGVHASLIPLRYGPASGELVAMEILGYFAVVLLYCVGLHPVSLSRMSVDDLQRFEEGGYCPAWHLSKQRRQDWLIRMRPRVTEQLVQRLVRRYKGTPLQRALSSSAPSGWTLPELFDIGEGNVPTELLHFPAGEACKP
jgi:hypothetical protein